MTASRGRQTNVPAPPRTARTKRIIKTPFAGFEKPWHAPIFQTRLLLVEPAIRAVPYGILPFFAVMYTNHPQNQGFANTLEYNTFHS
jgi:hypothetical protein